MFQNQSYKQKLSFTKNSDEDDVVNINIVLNTNHEINKDIITDIENVVSSMFLSNYTNTEDLVKQRKELEENGKRLLAENKRLAQQNKEDLKMKKEKEKEDIKLKKEHDKINKQSVAQSRNWGHRKNK